MYAVTVPAMVYMVYNSYLEFMENPLFTTVETEYFPTHELNFPGKLNLRNRKKKKNNESKDDVESKENRLRRLALKSAENRPEKWAVEKWLKAF